jgi:hypothetical protein
MTARPLRPPTGSGVTFGLEAWLTGTPAELDAALAALASVGRVACHGIGGRGTREPLAGADYGRYRTYALTHLTAARSGPARTADVEAVDD